MKKLMVIFLLLPFLLKAQDTIMNGKCYQKAWEKDEYKTVTEQVMVKEGCLL